MTRPGKLPPNPSLRQLRIQAKELCRALHDGSEDAIDRFGQAHPRLSNLSQKEIAANDISLADAQLVVAKECGFDSWPRLKAHIDSLSSAAINMHELVTGDDLSAMQDAVALDPTSIDQRNESGLPPLYMAALYGNHPAIKFLLGHGAAIDIFACGYLGKPQEAEALLEANRELVRAKTPDGMTALHYVARAGHYDVADLLLRYGADVNACDDNGRTALTEACHGGPWKQDAAEDVIQLLLDHDAHIDLCTAAAMGRVDLIRKLLDKDVGGINEVNGKEETALLVAAHNNRFKAVKLLVERGADVNRADAVGAAALHGVSQ
ncbi:MAG: ankyrin repeat domain-containing protein [Fuerstiella sp.]